MFTKGVELARTRSGKYCSEYHCHKVSPLCLACISPECCETVSKWCHFSAGEHVCSACYSRIMSFFSYSKRCDEVSRWKRRWLARSMENATVLDFIVDQLMPQWCLCCKCGKWRQVSRDITLLPEKVANFKCSFTLPCSKVPCDVSEDSRIDFIRKQSQSFFESLKYKPLLETIPCIEMYHSYFLDQVGVCPAATFRNFSFTKCPDFLVKFNPYLKRNKFSMAAGSIDPACMEIWEHEMFPMFNDNLRNVFIGLRDLMLSLWSADPKRVVDEQLLIRYVSVKGLAKVALMIHTIPDLVRVYTGLGYINHGFVDTPVHIFEKSRRIVIIDANLSGLSTAKHLKNLGADVTVLETNTKSFIKTFFDVTKEVEGDVNNPLVISAYQLDIDLEPVSNFFRVYDHDGRIISDHVDQYMQKFVYDFVGYMDQQINVLKNTTLPNKITLQDLYQEYHSKKFDHQYNEFLHVEQVYLSELEYRLMGGASLGNVSTAFQSAPFKRNCSNFHMKGFSGGVLEPRDSWDVLYENILSQFETHFSSEVRSVTKSTDRYIVSTSSGDFVADNIIFCMDPWDLVNISMSPGILNIDEDIKDQLDLQRAKVDVGGTLFIIHMVYDTKNTFWRKDPTNEPMGTFAIASKTQEEEGRGFCHVFREMDHGDGKVVLTTKIFGTAARSCHDLQDIEIISRVVNKLQILSSSSNLPDSFHVHRFPASLLSSTDFGLSYSKAVTVSEECSSSVYIGSVCPGLMNPPQSLSLVYTTGLETATYLVKNTLPQISCPFM